MPISSATMRAVLSTRAMMGFRGLNSRGIQVKLYSSSSASASSPDASVKLTFDPKTPALATLIISNRPRRNALTPSMIEDLSECVESLSEWSRDDPDARCLILTGAGGAFCSGLDLKSGPLPDGEAMARTMSRTTNRLRSLPVVSVAAVDGPAVGGGAELTTAADFRVLGHGASVTFVHLSRGAVPGWGGARRLTSIVGRSAALRLLLGGVEISGSDAVEKWRFAEFVGDEGETAADAARRLLVNQILALPSAEAVRALKRQVRAADGDLFSVSADGELMTESCVKIQEEIDAFASIWGSESNRKAVESALEQMRQKK